MKLPAQYEAASRALAHRQIVAQNEDSRRGDFLRAMEKSGEVLYEFEESFMASFLRSQGKADPALDFRWFTPKRRAVVDGMIKRYGLRTLKPVPRVHEIAPATPGLCGYLVRDANSLEQRCNQKAEFKLGNLELCDGCRRTREEGFAKMKRNLRR